jgi:CO/xanthine dehydrogenase Mo-binding subunit
MVQMAAEAMGVPLEQVYLIASDTAETRDSGSASASRMTYMAGNAIRGAIACALQEWEREERPAVGEYCFRPRPTFPYDPKTHRAVPYASTSCVAAAVTVDVDLGTGMIELVDVVCANDVGNAINPQQVQGQIEGAVVQAAGYAIWENFLQEEGNVDTLDLSTYLIPTTMDIPERVDALILEYRDEAGPWGARGMGEVPFLPIAPAIVAAVHDATGVWFDRLPLRPERIMNGLAKHIGRGVHPD